ncbi:MAG: RICIN domain-containing protein [Propionicimonas sp.]
MGATYLPSDLTDTGSFMVTNTGSVAGSASVDIAAPESWASGLPIRVWPTTAGACNVATPPGSAVSGTWADPPALTPSLAAGASVTYCVRTTIVDWMPLATAGGSRQANPVITVSLSADGWAATAPTATHVQRTAGMYPLTANFFNATLSRWFTVRANADTGYCLDVNASGGAGTGVLSWGCHANSNQRWEFVPVSGTNQSLVTIRPRHAMTTRLADSGPGVVIQTSASTTAQRWYVQAIDANRFQLVNQATGLCLGLSTSQGASAMVACSSASAQLRFQREPLTFGQSGDTLTLSFNSTVTGGTLQRCNNAACTSPTNVATIANMATSISFSRDAQVPSGTRIFRIIDGSSNVLWNGIQLRRNGSTVTAIAGIG